MAKEKHYIHIAIEKDRWEKIKQIADSKEISVSAIIRLLLNDYIKKEEKNE
jgi:predicted DNA-binding ribbon-helix-helix protein